MLSRKEACSIFEEDIEPVWSTGIDCGRLEVRTPLQLKTGCNYRQTQKETRYTCGHSTGIFDRNERYLDVVHIPYYYIRKYRIGEPKALYSAVTNGGSTLEGYYKTKFGVS